MTPGVSSLQCTPRVLSCLGKATAARTLPTPRGMGTRTRGRLATRRGSCGSGSRAQPSHAPAIRSDIPNSQSRTHQTPTDSFHCTQHTTRLRPAVVPCQRPLPSLTDTPDTHTRSSPHGHSAFRSSAECRQTAPLHTPPPSPAVPALPPPPSRAAAARRPSTWLCPVLSAAACAWRRRRPAAAAAAGAAARPGASGRSRR